MLTFATPPTIDDESLAQLSADDLGIGAPLTVAVVGNTVVWDWEETIVGPVTVQPPPNGVSIGGIPMCGGIYTQE